ncbi:MAG: aspartate aminotransferase family protein [Clostridia bacterium]
MDAQRRYLMPGVGLYYREPLVLVEGSGTHVTDDRGTRYLDFFGGILTVSIGHAHPAITAAVTDQVRTLVHTSTEYITEPMVDLAERLAALTPGGLQQSFFTTSGTEANETAVALAQRATGSSEIIALRHSYSGRSQLGMGLTGQAPWRQGLGALPVRHALNPYCYRCPFNRTPDTCALECAKDLEELIATSTTGRPAAFLAEPIQGVGGFITPPKPYFEEAVSIVRKHGALFIDDEVQTGFGRTGYAFGIDYYGVVPDIMTFAKGLANGLPVGATITTADIARPYTGPTISTFGGNPLSMRAALATLDVMASENLTANVTERGRELRAGLEEVSDRYPAVGDVRGRGLMQGLEMVRADKAPAPDLAGEVMEGARARGLLVGRGGLYGNTIRLAPPMTVPRSEVEEAVHVLRHTMDEIYQRHPELSQVTPTRVPVS